MIDWFNALQRREKLSLSVGAVFAVIVLGWVLLWSLPHRGINSLSQSLVVKQLLLSNLRVAQSMVLENPESALLSAQSLIVVIDQTHRQFGLAGKLTRNQPDGTDGIRVNFQATPFDALLSWLIGLEANYGIHVESAAINKTSQTGLVTATLVLRRT